MSKTTLAVGENVYRYILDHTLRESELLARLRDETAELPESRMQIAPDQGQFMALLLRLISARCTLEVGTFTGYSALVTAQALPEDGRVVACDVSEEWTAIARRYWQEAGVAHKIELHLRPALETLDGLLESEQDGGFDFAFIDADKPTYIEYYERCLALLRSGGLIAIDNVLWHGDVVDPEKTDEDTEAIRRFNDHLRDDQRVDIALVPIGDGLTLACKR